MHMHRRHCTKDALWQASGLSFLAWAAASAEGAQPGEAQCGPRADRDGQPRNAWRPPAPAATRH